MGLRSENHTKSINVLHRQNVKLMDFAAGELGQTFALKFLINQETLRSKLLYR
jgi:hypothetical protein